MCIRDSISHNEAGMSLAEFDFVEGMDLAKKLSLNIKEGKAPENEINKAINMLLGDGTTGCHNMDALFENVIVGNDGSCTLIDYEWVFDDELDREYLKYRILKMCIRDSLKCLLLRYYDRAVCF